MGQYTILIVDYEPRSVVQLRETLEPAGYRVELARDGMAGAQMFHDLKPDLVLVEAMLPKKHGFELCSELKRTTHGQITPIVIITGVYKGRKYRTQAMHQHRCDAYLEKPIESEQLLDTIRQLLERYPRPHRPTALVPQPPPPPAPEPEPEPEPVVERDPFADEIEGHVDAILGEEPRAPVGIGGGKKAPRASVVELDPRPRRVVGSAHGRGGAQPALFSRADLEVVRGVAMPDEDVELGEGLVASAPALDSEGGSGRHYSWIAFGVLVVFAATLLILLY